MKKRALRKDFHMEIKRTQNRFLSIFFIVALGVAFFSGIQSSAPDMRFTGDAYFDNTNLMDLRVIGTLGLSEHDIEALRAVDGVEMVEPGYMTDVLCGEGEHQSVLHVESLLPTINQLSVQEGGLPTESGQCFLDKDFMDRYGYQVGDRIELILPEDKETDPETSDDTLILKTTSYIISGSGYSSGYLSFGKGSSTLGNGEVAGLMYVLPEDFDSEAYMVAYLAVEGAKEQTAYTDGYDSLIGAVQENVEAIEGVRCEARYREVVDEANEKLDEYRQDLAEGETKLADAKGELADGKREAESELADAKEELESGESELESGRQELENSKKDIADAKQQIADGEAEIADKEGQLNDARRQLEAGETQLDSAEKTLGQKQSEYNRTAAAANKELSDGQKQIDQAKKEIEEGTATLDAKSQELEQAARDSSEAKKVLDASQKQYEEGAAALGAAESEYASNKALLDAAESEYASNKALLDGAESEYASNKAALDAAESEYASNKAALDAAELQYASDKAALDAAWLEYHAAFDAFSPNLPLIDQLDSQLDGLRTDRESAAGDAASKRSAANETSQRLGAENSGLQSQIEEKNGQIGTLNGTIGALEGQISQLNNEIAGLQAALDAETDEAKQAELRGQISAKTADRDACEGSRAAAISDRDALQGAVNSLAGQISANQNVIAAAENEAVEAEGKVTELDGQIGTVSGQLDGLRQTESELAGWKSKLDGNSEQLAAGRAQLDANGAELAAGRAQLDANGAELAAGRTQLDANAAELAAGRAQLDANGAELAAGRTQLDEKNAELSGAKSQIDAGYQQLSEGQAQIEAGRTQIEQGRQELAAGQKEITQNQTKIDESKKALADGKSQLDAGWKKINSNRQTLRSSRSQLEDGASQLEDGKKTLADSKQEVADGEQKLSEAESEIAENEQKIKDGWEEYEDGRKEAEDKIKEGEDKIRDAEGEMADARKKIEDAQKEIDDIKKPEWYVHDRSILPEHAGFGENADRMTNIGKVFPLLFFLVAALISLTTMTRMVEEERTQIGTLKALGYSKTSIASKYMKYALYATLGGGLFGILVGEKILPYIIIFAYGMMYHHIPQIVIPYNWSFGLIAMGAALVCTLGATFLSCWKELASYPAVLMRPPAPKEGKRVWLEFLPFLWRRLTFTWKSTVRNLFRYKKRFFMTVIGIGGCMGLLLVGFGLKDSIMGIARLQYGELQYYNQMVILDGDSSDKDKAEVDEFLAEDGRIAGAKKVYALKVSVMDGKKEYNPYIYVPENVENLEQFMVFRDRVTHREYHLSDEGAIITEKLADMLDLSVGDELVIHDDDLGELKVPITDIAENYLYHYVYMTPACYQRIYGKAPDYNSILVKVREEEAANNHEIGRDVLALDGVLNVTYTDTIEGQMNDMLGSLNIVVAVLIISAGMLAFVVLYNLNNININERKRELATIKVLGFYDKEVDAYVYRENILLTIIGAAVGIGIGIALHRYIMTTVEVDLCMFGRNIFFPSYVYSVLFTFAFSAIISFVMHFKLKKIDMVESLKSVE